MAVVVQTQTVLYNDTLSDIWRFVRGLTAAIKFVPPDLMSGFSIKIGDASPSPCCGEEALRDLAEYVQRELSIELDYQFFNENRMTAKGHNSLAAGSTADYILVINPDTYPRPDLLANLIRSMEDVRIAAAEARQFPVEHPKAYDPVTLDTSWASGCCVLYRSSAFAEVGGYDQHFFPLYCDDVDLSWRFKLAGYRVVFAPDAGVFHDKQVAYSSGTVEASPVEQYYGAHSRLLLCRRYGRPDLEAKTLEDIEDHGADPLRRAAADFQDRIRTGDVPDLLERSHDVAQFVDGEYAEHRY